MLLILSHGQANVERGFSVNKEVFADNMEERSITSQRIMLDHMKYIGFFDKFKVTSGMLKAAMFARSKYRENLEANKRACDSVSKKRKLLQDKVTKIKAKKMKVEKDVVALEKTVVKLAEEAEITHKIEFITQSNALRRSAETKKELVKECAKVRERTHSLE